MPKTPSMTVAHTPDHSHPERAMGSAQPASATELGFVVLGLLALYIPTYIKLANEFWSQEGQGHGPVMLALMLWLTWKRWGLLLKAPKQPALVSGGLSLALGLFLYVIGRSQEFPELEVGSQFFVLPGLLLIFFGWPTLKIMRFPIFFLIFIIPLPFIVVNALTAPLKAGVSYAAESILYKVGYPIGRTGVTLTIGQYKLLVADACAGLNSIFSLEAIGVFYLSVSEYTNRVRNLALAILIVPISFVSNVLRVITLVLITYYFGDEAGQGFVHSFAGILLFMVATALTIGTDTILGLFVPAHEAPRNLKTST
jgi:exosortase B